MPIGDCRLALRQRGTWPFWIPKGIRLQIGNQQLEIVNE